MTITLTQLESTSNLGNRKLQDYDRNVGGDTGGRPLFTQQAHWEFFESVRKLRLHYTC